MNIEGNQQVESKKLLRRKLDLLLRTGKILVESSADTSRVMRNMKRTAAYLGLNEEHLHIHITYNMLHTLAGCHCGRLGLWWFLYSVWLRLDSFLLRVYSSNLRLSSAHKT